MSFLCFTLKCNLHHHNAPFFLCRNIDNKRENYLEWPEYFMAVAFLSAMRSKDPCSQVGACIVNSDLRIVGVGYNGMPIGCNDDLLPWNKTSSNPIETKYMFGNSRRNYAVSFMFIQLFITDISFFSFIHIIVCHAEMNAIMNKNSADLKGCTLYVALFPCNECAKMIIQSGIKLVIYMSDKHKDKPTTEASKMMLDMAGIK